MASPESCCGAGFATVSDIGRHYNTTYGQSIPHVELCGKGPNDKEMKSYKKQAHFLVRNL